MNRPGRLVLTLMVGLAGGPALGADSVTTGVTYQGRLLEDGAPATGDLSVDFELYDAPAGGTQIGSTLNLNVSFDDDGRFTVNDLDFGPNAYTGDARWLEIIIDGVALSPRHEFSPAPFAAHALNAPFQTNGSTIWYDGPLALGTDAPEGQLSIENVGGVDGAVLLNFSENDNLEFFFESGFAGSGSSENFMRLNTLWGNAMTWYGNGRTGIRETNPQAQLHVTETPITFDPAAVNGDDFILEDNDAVIGVYSNEGGNAGSGLVLGEITAGALVDKWAITRETSGLGSGLRFSYNPDDGYFGNAKMYLTPDGDLGLGTGAAAPQARLDVFDDAGPATRIELDNPAHAAPAVHLISNGEVFGHSTLKVQLDGGLFAAGIFDAPDATAVYAEGTRGVWARSTGNGGLPLIAESYGTIVPDNIALFKAAGLDRARIDSTGRGFFNGGTQSSGADVAEAFAVEGDVSAYVPGDVLVISTTADRTVTLSVAPYSTLVAGVHATKPGVLLTERSMDESLDDLVPMGVVGVIPTKVSGENGSIRRGDLLVTSATPGHAMKGTDRTLLVGAIIGKALENFDGPDTGVISVMVNVK